MTKGIEERIERGHESLHAPDSAVRTSVVEAGKVEMASAAGAEKHHGSGQLASDKWAIFKLKAGDKDEAFGVTILSIIIQTSESLVYLDEKFDTYWRTTSTIEAKIGSVLNRVAALEAIPLSGVDLETRLAFRSQVAEGVARALDGDPDAAVGAHDRAEAFIRARLREIARSWYLSSAMVALALSASAAVVAYVGARILDQLDDPAAQFLFCVLTGALGACFSLISRLSSFPLDPSAGRPLHRLEAHARVVVGALGAAVAFFAIRTKEILPSLQSHGPIPQIVIAFVAGVSERFVPNLVARVEAADGSTFPRTAPAAATESAKAAKTHSARA